jgi:hypothetical protein
MINNWTVPSQLARGGEFGSSGHNVVRETVVCIVHWLYVIVLGCHFRFRRTSKIRLTREEGRSLGHLKPLTTHRDAKMLP